VEILLVEDNPGDYRLTQEALREGKVYNNLHWAQDGVEALEFLHQRGKYANVPRPDIILLDLNLPKKDGRQVLSEIKSDEDLRPIPVVILTTSQAERTCCAATTCTPTATSPSPWTSRSSSPWCSRSTASGSPSPRCRPSDDRRGDRGAVRSC
jgi:CheY-like chemotaxis protein